MSGELFREQALTFSQDSNKGSVLISQPLPGRWITTFLSLITLVILVFLVLNSYTKKQKVAGQVISDTGIISLHPPNGGMVTRIYFKNGDEVQAGDLLMELRVDQTISGVHSLAENSLDLLDQEVNTSHRNAELQLLEIAAKIGVIETRESMLEKEINEIRLLLDTASDLLELKETALARSQELYDKRVISALELDRVKEQFFMQESSGKQYALRLLDAQHQLFTVTQERTLLQFKKQEVSNFLESELNAINTRRNGIEGQVINKIFAPVNAIVTNLYVHEFQMLSARDILADIMPTQSKLQLELHVPSAAIGFLENGQNLNIRFDAYPYQKFGLYNARITNISHSLLYPEESLDLSSNRAAIYKVIAEFDDLALGTNTTNIKLRPGMRLEADVILDDRSLLEWLLEPLYSMRGRV